MTKPKPMPEGGWKRVDSWTEAEDAVIRQLWPSKGIACASEVRKVAKIFRSDKAIQTRAQTLKVRDARRINKKPEKKRSEPLIAKSSDPRCSSSCYGYIPGGPAPSVFHLGALE